MIHELDSTKFRRVNDAPVVAMPTAAPQEGDNELVLMGKMVALLRTIWQTQPHSGVIYDRAGNALQVRKAKLNATAGTADQQLVPALADHVIRVLSLKMVAGGTATDVTFQSKLDAVAAVDVSPLFANAANGGAVLPHDDHGHFEDTASGAALVVLTGAGSSVGIMLSYVYLPDAALEWNDGDPITWNDGSQIE